MRELSNSKENKLKLKRCLNCGKILKPDDYGYEQSICGKCMLELLNKVMSPDEPSLEP